MSGTKNQKRTCQECNSENVKFSDKRQAYVCSDCLHEFAITSSGHPRIFISYAREDGEEFARKLRRCLVEEHGFSVWQDRTEMQVGKVLWQQIESALRNEHMEYLVLVMTPAAMKSKMVQKEWRLARQEGVCVLPVMASHDLDFNNLPPWMSAIHFTDLSVPEEKKRFIRILEGPCKIQRVPFMAEDLPRDFVPREEEFKQIVSGLLDTHREEPVAITAALRGAGGYGKTTLAQIICHDERIQEDFYDGILWVTLGEKPGDLTTYVEDFIRILSGEPSGLVNLQAATVRLIELLANRHILMVIDDVWNSAHLRPFLQGGSLCARLITTRNLDTVPFNAIKVNVDAMQEHEATALLAADLPSGHETDMTRLAARLSEWPLLLKLVNGALYHRVHNTGQGLAAALLYVNTALDKRGLTVFDARDATQRDQAVEKTLGVSFELLQPDEHTRYGELAVFPEDEDIPLAALENLWNKTGGLDEFDTDDLCDRFMRLSLLLNFDLNKRHIRLHDVMREYLIQKRNDTLPILHNQLLEAYYPSNQNIPQWADLSPDEPYIWNNLAYHLIESGRNEELHKLLLDFDWLQAKLEVTDITSLISDYSYLSDDTVLNKVQGALKLSANVLFRDPYQLACQLLGRLQMFQETEIQSMLEQACGYNNSTWLRPLKVCLASPGDSLIRTMKGHSSSVNAVVVTPDGQRVISGSDDTTIKVWNLETGEHIRTMEGHNGSVNSLTVTPDGLHVISGSDDKTIKVWNLETGEHIRTMEGHNGSVSVVAVTPDGRCAISGSYDKTIKVWDMKTGGHIRTMKDHYSSVMALADTPEGLYVISQSEDKMLKVWDLKTGDHISTMGGHNGFITAVVVTPDGRRAISGSDGKMLRVWDLKTGDHIRTMKDHYSLVMALAVTSDGRRVISGSMDNMLRVWDLETGDHICTMKGHNGWVSALAVTPDGCRAISGSDDTTIKLWGLETGQNMYTMEDHNDWVGAVAVAPDNRCAISASYKMLKIWDLKTGENMRTLESHNDFVSSVAFTENMWPIISESQNEFINTLAVTPDSLWAISALYDKMLKVWDLETGEHIRTMEGHNESVSVVAVTPDGRLVISASYDKTIKVWDLETGDNMHTLKGHNNWVSALAVTPDSLWAISASYDKTIKVWDLETGDNIHTMKGHNDFINTLTVTSDGRFVISGSIDNMLKVWDLETGNHILTLEIYNRWVMAVAVTPDSQRVISASYDKTIKVWNAIQGRHMHTLKGHNDVVSALAVTSDGRLAISGSIDNTLKVWDLETGNHIRTLEGHNDWVMAVAVTSDGRLAISGSIDNTLKVWNLETGDHIRTMKGHNGWVSALAVTPDGRLAISGSVDNTLKVWDLKTGDNIHTIKGHNGWIMAVAVTPDNRCVISASGDNMLKLWDLETGKHMHTLEGHNNLVMALAVTPDGRRAISVSDNEKIKSWDLKTGDNIRSLKFKNLWVSNVAVTPDGRRAISTSNDTTIKVWDLKTGEYMYTFEGHKDRVHAVAVTPDGRRAISTSQDSMLKVWDIETGNIITEFNGDSPIYFCAVSSDGVTIVAGDRLGRVHLLRLEEKELHPGKHV